MDELAKRLAQGDQAAFAELYDRYADRIHHYLLVVLGCRADADDALHETFIRLVRSRHRLATVTNLTGYVFRIARNEAARLAKRRSRGNAAEPFDLADCFDHSANADAKAREVAESVLKGLTQLTLEQREVVELHIYADLPFREIAELVDLPLGTVATRYRAAIAVLRQSLSRELR
jgi:RNA polymerase sigma-70 factor (ECF subfamily)